MVHSSPLNCKLLVTVLTQTIPDLPVPYHNFQCVVSMPGVDDTLIHLRPMSGHSSLFVLCCVFSITLAMQLMCV